MRHIVLGCSVLFFCSLGLRAQNFSVGPCSGAEANTSSGWSIFHQSRACEMRRTTLLLDHGELNVRNKNGGIEVIGEDRPDIALEARVVAQASSQDEARKVLQQIHIRTDGQIRPEGPENLSGFFGGSNWSVNFRLRVPRRLATARLQTENGGIVISKLDGSILAQTTNGGVQLTDLAGEVHASTTNGGLDITLDGNQWHGAGLFAKTTNGGVDVKAPNGYSAHLIAQTVNGGISVAFPVTVQGRINHHLETNLGQGGPTLQLETVNGGVSIDRSDGHSGRDQREE